jgi:butyrate kinase
MGKDYSECRFIVAHMGGGITVGAHKYGRIIDVNNGLDGDGPFTPERSGSLPAGQLVSLCFNSGKTEKEIRKMIKGEGGVVAYCRTNDIRELERLTEEEKAVEKSEKKENSKKSGNGRAEQIQMESEVKDISPSVVLEAFCRQTAQAICAHGATLEGKIDAVILTGGVAYSEKVTSRLIELCGWMADIKIIPGEREMEALAEGALRVLRGEEKTLEYVS